MVDEFTAGVLDRMAGRDRGGRIAVHLGPRQLLAVGVVRPRDQARAQPAAGVHLPHPRPGQGGIHARGGGGRHAPPPGRGRGVHHRLLRRRAGLLHGGGRPDRIALRRRARTHPHRAARRGPRLLRSGPPAASPPRPRSAARAGGSSSSSGGSSRSSGPTWPSRHWPSCASAAASPTASWSSVARAAPTARSRCRACTTRPTPAACASTCTSSRPSRTSCSRRTTGRPTSASCPAAPESFGLVALEAAACGTPVVASAVGGLTTLVDHGHTGYLVDDPDPVAYAAAVRTDL